jgi:uncharacterized repeat protein (TIGR03806 family)
LGGDGKVKALALLALFAMPAVAEVNSAAIAAQRPPKTLAEFGFFDGLGTDKPALGVVPYQIASVLFSDYADKDRYMFTPAPAMAVGEGVLPFPVGAALIKTFRYGTKKVETRVLLHQDAGWKGYAYLWNEAGTEATLALAGADLSLQTEQGTLNYHVPNANQCKACHVGPDKAMTPIGPKLRNLNMGDQLALLVAAGAVDGVPDPAPAMPDYRDESVSIDLRARAYLDINCGHCHAAGLPADTSGLFLNWEESDPLRLGINKRPVAAGKGSGHLAFDVVPGEPEASILLFRMMSTDPGAMMPEIGRSVMDPEGAELIRQWIAGLEG